MQVGSVSVAIDGSSEGLKTAFDQSANAARDYNAKVRDYFADVTAKAGDHAETLGRIAANTNQRLSSVASGLDNASTAAALAAAGFDAMKLPMVSDRMATLSGRIEEVNGVVKLASAGTLLIADHLGTASMVADDFSRRLGDVSVSAEEAAKAQTDVANSAEEASAGWGTWLALAAVTATVAAGIYVAYSAVEAVAKAARDAASAAIDYAAEISGAAAMSRQLSADAQAAAAAVADLAREMGFSAEHLAHLSDVARDYKVTQEQAEAVMRRLAEILDVNNDKTAEARKVLEAYGLSLRDLSGQDWAAVLDRFAQAMNGVRDSSQKTRDAIAVLGSEGSRWLKGIADGAGDMSHAATEADRIYALVAARIAESNKRLGEHKGYWDGVIERFDTLISRSEEFKAKQEYAVSHVAIAWREFGNSNQSIWAEMENLVAGVAKTAEDYGRLLAEKIIPLQGLVKPLEVPKSEDNRPQSPVATREQIEKVWANKTEDTTVQDYERVLDELKLRKENWLTWNRQKEIAFWEDLRNQLRSEWSETMSAEEIERSKIFKALEGKIGGLKRDQAQEDAQPKQGQVEQWRNELELMKAEQGRWFNWSREEEEAFWRDKLALVKAGSRESTQIQRELLNLRREQAQDELDSELAHMRAAQEAERGNAAVVVAISQVMATRIADTYGERSRRHQQALLDVERAERAHQEQMRRLAEMASDSQAMAANDNYERSRNDLAFRRQMGQITAVEEIQQLRSLEQQKHQIEQQTRRDKLSNIREDVEARRRAELEIERMDKQHSNRMRQSRQQEALAMKAAYREWMSPITDATRSMVQGLMQGTLTARQLVH